MISIIVPVFKAEKFLNRCLSSIKNQTHTDWECILVDDGSPDNSRLICDEFAQSDERFRVFHQANSGVSSARNLGLDKAKGEWITFIDADDFISTTYLEKLYIPITKDNQIDIVNGSGTYFKDGKILGVIEELDDFVSDDIVFLFSRFKGYICGRLYKRMLIEKGIKGMPLRFDVKIRFSEDKIFMMQFVSLVKRYAISSECGYYYNRDNESSATHLIKLSYEEAVRNFKIKYDILNSFVLLHNISENQILKQFVSVSRTLYPILCDINTMNISIDEKINKVKSEIGVVRLSILRYVPSPPLTKFVLKLFMTGKLVSAFRLLKLSVFEIKVINKLKGKFTFL